MTGAAADRLCTSFRQRSSPIARVAFAGMATSTVVGLGGFDLDFGDSVSVEGADFDH